MADSIQSISLGKLIAHPDNPNRMSKINFSKLVRNIKRTGRYEPIIVRPNPKREDCFQIINGEHRCRALAKLGYKDADCIVWDVDDKQADILLATLNRLGGTDKLEKKLNLLKRLNKKMESAELSKLLPQTTKQIERLVNFSRISGREADTNARRFLNPMVFFVNDAQQETVENALSSAGKSGGEKRKAVRRAEALVRMAEHFLRNCEFNSGA